MGGVFGVLDVVYFMIRYSNGLGFMISVLVFLTTFIIEYFGSAYEILFGAYTYMNQFAPKVFGVPIAIGFAWVMVIATGHAILSKLAIQNPLQRRQVGLITGFPRFYYTNWLDRLVIPMMHFFVNFHLPIYLANQTTWPAATAANGAFLLFDKETYEKIEGHTSLQHSLLEDVEITHAVKRQIRLFHCECGCI